MGPIPIDCLFGLWDVAEKAELIGPPFTVYLILFVITLRPLIWGLRTPSIWVV